MRQARPPNAASGDGTPKTVKDVLESDLGGDAIRVSAANASQSAAIAAAAADSFAASSVGLTKDTCNYPSVR